MDTLPAGTYYVGDLCYVMHDVWDEFCDTTIQGYDVLDGVFNLKDGRQYASFTTHYGDGLYWDQDGREYGVDAGLIGCILTENITDPEPSKGGQYITFDKPFRVWKRDGTIHIGHIAIPTAEYGYEDEEDYA